MLNSPCITTLFTATLSARAARDHVASKTSKVTEATGAVVIVGGRSWDGNMAEFPVFNEQ